MKRILLFTTALVLLTSARITIPITQRQLPDAMLDELDKYTAEAFLATGESNTADQLRNITMRNMKNLYYSGTLYVGPQNTPFQVLLDSGSNLLWLPLKSCLACPAKTKYVCEDSSTCYQSTTFNALQYGLGYVQGYMGYENIGFTKDFQVNASLLWVSYGKDLTNYQDMDGFIGLGNMESTNDFIDLAFKGNYIQEKVFSFHLDHNPDINSPSKGSYLSIGYIPEEKVNKLTWVPVTNRERWSARVYKMKVGNVQVDTGSDMVATEVLFDTGCSFNYMSPALVNELTKQLKELDQTVILGTGFYRCDSEYLDKYPNLTVSLSGMDVTLNVYNYLYFTSPLQKAGKNYCQLAMRASTFGLQILGDAFLKNNFVTFSKRNQSMGIHQEYRPIVLPPAAGDHFFIVLALIVAALAAIFIFRGKKTQVKKLDTFLKNEGGVPNDSVAI